MFNNEVKVVPHIGNLRNKDFIWFLEEKWENSLVYLPEDYKKRSINRQWLWNLCINNYLRQYLGNTLNSEDFEEMISEAIKER